MSDFSSDPLERVKMLAMQMHELAADLTSAVDHAMAKQANRDDVDDRRSD